MMLTPEEADRRLVLADVAPLMDSRVSTRLLRRFTSSPVRKNVSDMQVAVSSADDGLFVHVFSLRTFCSK